MTDDATQNISGCQGIGNKRNIKFKNFSKTFCKGLAYFFNHKTGLLSTLGTLAKKVLTASYLSAAILILLMFKARNSKRYKYKKDG